MKKIKLLITSAALLVGGGLLASSSNNIMKANAATIGVDTSSYTFEKVTSVDAFFDGGQFIFAAGNVDVEKIGTEINYMGELTGSYFSRVTSLEDALLLDIEMQSDGNYSISVGNGKYLSYDVDSKNSATSSDVINDSSLWNFKYENDTWTIKNVSETSRIFQYNASSPRFACYTSSQTKISIFEVSSIDTYNVTFYDGNNVIHTEQVNSGDLIDFSSINVEKDGYVFDGWYEDPEFKIAYDEDAPVTEDLNLYALYIAHEDLTSGEIFASETTKTSLIANTTSTITEYSEELKIVEDAPLESLFEYTIVKASGGNNQSKIYSDSWRVYGGNTITLSSEYTIDHITYKTDTGKDDLITSIKELTNGASIESTGNHMGTITVNSKSFSFSLGSQSRITEFTIFYSNFETIQVTNASIRFGATLDSKIYDETATYGVIFGLNGEDINTLAENETSVENLLINNKTLHSAQASNIAMVDTDTGAVEESKNPETAPYFQYAIVIKDMLEHIGEEITAACYMETNDNLYVMNEVTYSVKTLSNEYLNNIEEGTLSEDYKDILNAILNYNA